MAVEIHQMNAQPIAGRIEVSPNAIASLAAQASLECYGVVGMASPNFVNGLAELSRRQDDLPGHIDE